MVHISQLDTFRVDKVSDIVKLGDEIMVMVTAIGSDGKIRLSRQAVLEGWTLEEAQARDGSAKRGGRSSGGRSGGGQRSGSRDRGRSQGHQRD
nr:S1 RNA-binding domain-containing protein [Anaerolineae bacterium]